MSKPKPKRTKKYAGPKGMLVNPVDWAIAGATLMPAEQKEKAMSTTQAGFDALRRGVATPHHWNCVSQALNVSEQLCKMNIGNNLLSEIHAGMAALDAIAHRMLTRKTSTPLYAAELDALAWAVAFHKSQIDLCTQAEFSRAVKAAKNRVQDENVDQQTRDLIELSDFKEAA